MRSTPSSTTSITSRRFLKDGIIPAEVILSAASYRPQCQGLDPPRASGATSPESTWCGMRTARSMFSRTTCACPRAFPRAREREVLKRTFPQVFEGLSVRPVTDYPSRLLETLEYLAQGSSNARTVVLTPGAYNSAYFEHSFLAQQMGLQLVEGRDLVVNRDAVYMRTTKGLQRVDVIYRRIDDDFLDPQAFRADSMLGVPGLMQAYRSGNVALANAPGNAWRTIRWCTPTCRKSSATTRAKTPSCPMCPLICAGRIPTAPTCFRIWRSWW